MVTSQTFRKIRAIVVAVALTLATNYAISLAARADMANTDRQLDVPTFTAPSGGTGTVDTPRPERSGGTGTVDTPRPERSGGTGTVDTPRPERSGGTGTSDPPRPERSGGTGTSDPPRPE